MVKSIEISDIMTDKGISEIKVGQILMFKKDGQRVDLKVTKVDRKNSRVWAKITATFAEEEIAVTSRGMFGKIKKKKLAEEFKDVQ